MLNQAQIKSSENTVVFFPRVAKGILTRELIQPALKKLAPHLMHEEHPYVISPHQFRHSIATDMIEQGIDIYTVKEFLGHKSLAMTEKYVKVYLSSLKAKYDAYRVKKQQTYATEMMTTQIQITQPESDADGGWSLADENRVQQIASKQGDSSGSPCPVCHHLPVFLRHA